MKSESLEGKSVIVTGGGSGIGRAAALLFAERGAYVTVADVSPDTGEAVAAEIVSNGGQAVSVRTDVSDAGDVERMVNIATERFGGLDCAFNNAGVEGRFSYTLEADENDFDRTVAVNLKGVWLCLRAELRQMLQQGGGSIVNTASVAGLLGWRGAAAYSATKHGVIGLTKTVALEYARRGIRVNAVCPGVIETPMASRVASESAGARETLEARHPQRRFGSPDEVAAAAVWLCGDGSSFTTGHALTVDGGFVAQ